VNSTLKVTLFYNFLNEKMGPKLWDKFEDDFKLEYMDLDEFLTENELPIETVLHEQQHDDDDDQKGRKDSMQTQHHILNHQIQQHQQHQQHHLHLQVMCDLQQHTSIGGQVPSLPDSSILLAPAPVVSQTDPAMVKIEGNYPAISDGLQHQLSAVTMSPSQKPLPSFPSTYQVTSSSMDSNIQLDQEHSNGSRDLDKSEGVNKSGILLASKTRDFIFQILNDSCKDEKYWERRRKNNLAAKRSRDARRAKENQVGYLMIFQTCQIMYFWLKKKR
jgi:hypothetical protein